MGDAHTSRTRRREHAPKKYNTNNKKSDLKKTGDEIVQSPSEWSDVSGSPHALYWFHPNSQFLKSSGRDCLFFLTSSCLQHVTKLVFIFLVLSLDLSNNSCGSNRARLTTSASDIVSPQEVNLNLKASRARQKNLKIASFLEMRGILAEWDRVQRILIRRYISAVVLWLHSQIVPRRQMKIIHIWSVLYARHCRRCCCCTALRRTTRASSSHQKKKWKTWGMKQELVSNNYTMDV